MVLASRTTTIRYSKKPQAAVQYDIVLSKGTLTFNPNKSADIEGSLEWKVYKIEGESRTLMANSGAMTCRCGYTDSPTHTAGIDTADNVTFDDDGSAQRAYKKGETDKFTIVYGQLTGGVFIQLARLDIPVIVVGKDAAVVASIDFDNNNASILYNSITGKFIESSYPVSNISVVEDGVDISEMAKVHIKSYGLIGTITRDKNYTLSTSFDADLSGTGVVSIKIIGMQSGSSNGYILASYTDSAGVTHSTKFNVSRSVGRYAAEIITTPTQISYNQTTGIASSNRVTATLNVIDINGNRTTNAVFSKFGEMKWKYIGETSWREPSNQSITSLGIGNIAFEKSGIEFSFVDGSGNQLDYETVPISSVNNGGDSYLLMVASTNISTPLGNITYGKPTGGVTNEMFLAKNGVQVSSTVFWVNGDTQTVSVSSGESKEIAHHGWNFTYLNIGGKLHMELTEVAENSPTSVQIEVMAACTDDGTQINRTTLISVSAITRGPAGRSYKPNMPVIYQEGKEYVWNDDYRDFIYYSFKVNESGGQDDANGALSYFIYGVKEYGMTVATPPTKKGGDDNWEYVCEYSTIIVNCLFGTNAVMGGFNFTGEKMTSVSTDSEGNPNILIDGKRGEFTGNNCSIKGTIVGTKGSFENISINNNCRIHQSSNGGGWFLRGGSDPSVDKPDGTPSWWLGYEGKNTGQFTMETSYNDGTNHPPTVELTVMTPNIQGGSPSGPPLLSLYSNISQPLASFSHSDGIMVQICNISGEGIRFIQQGPTTHPAFCGEGHGCLKGVVQGYQLNVIKSGQIEISKGNTVYCNGGSSDYLVLPTLANCRGVLGTTGAFALDLTIIGAKGASNFRVYGKYHKSTTDCYLLHNDHGDNWYATMSQGDVLKLKLIYTGSDFYAYIVSYMR
jgi:hypothetical protein